MNEYIIPLDQLGINDIDQVGGKNASLGEMIQHLSAVNVAVPGGLATTAYAYKEFLQQGGLQQKIDQVLNDLNVDDIAALVKAGADIRQWIMETPFQAPFERAIEAGYKALEKQYGQQVTWAVRSSATAEDLPDASFAGQQETFLNIKGIEAIKQSIREVFASLFNDRAIAYRVHQGFAHGNVALSAGIQKMIRSDQASSGVMFSLDTETGFRDAVFITGSYGLGEMIVQGAVNPDEFYVHKPTLAKNRPAILRRTLGSKLIQMIYGEAGEAVKTEEVDEALRHKFCLLDHEVESLAEMAMTIEKHYGRGMDIEWAKDGVDGDLYIIQARPETVQSRSGQFIERYELQAKGELICEGRSIGGRIGQGAAKIIMTLDDMDKIKPGDVLVTDMTDPDWEPIMKRAAAIVTNRGGRTCHAAIIARELGVPAVVGCGNASSLIKAEQPITVSCAEGDTGFIYEGIIPFEHKKIALDSMPDLPVKIMMNIGTPDRAFDFATIPNAGVGLARMEFIINNMIGIHPRALLDYHQLSQPLQDEIAPLIAAYDNPRDFYIKKIIEGVSSIAAAFQPSPVIIRMSDFKSNEYANLIGGDLYEPSEENPMIGFRGASRYLDVDFSECFKMECEALNFIRNEMDLKNLEIMIPFVRTVKEAKAVVELLAENGLERGKDGLRLIMMCEIPSNALLAEQFLEYFDGFSIGSNDLTQLTLGLDRDSALVANSFDERNEAVKALMSMAIDACHKQGKYIGICGQGPSDYPDLAKWLFEQGITSVSLNPDTVIDTWLYMANQAKH